MAMCQGTVEGPDLTRDDVLLNPFPMVNMAGINGMFLPWLKVGGLLVQHHPFDLATFLRQISQHRATYTVAPPALLTALLHNEALMAQADISSLRILGSGSTPLAPSLLQGWHDKYGIEIINFYGSNEGIALLGTPKDIPDPAVRALYFPRYAARDWSITLSRTTLARIVDPATGFEISSAGVPGELRIKGPGVFPGYLPASGVPDPFDSDGYLMTGDILEIAGDELQYLHYVDRSKDMVVRGGMKISAAELEGFISGHPAVADVAVVAYPDEVLGERACAVVVTRPGQTVTLAEIIAYLRELGIATFKLPERLEIRAELPRNPLGKILKRDLRDELRNS
jgi:acyl-CoA synthetase (AMP-forming)/AMP-acid ligase II